MEVRTIWYTYVGFGWTLTARWQYSWLYIIEGCISVLVAFWVFFGLPANPTEAKFLTAEDKDVMTIREAQRAQYLGSLVFDWSEVGKAMLDPKVWLTYVLLELLIGSSLIIIIAGPSFNSSKTSFFMDSVHFCRLY